MKNPVELIIPCYNEEESIPKLADHCKRLSESLQDKGYELNLIFVDDASNDQTIAKIEECFSGRPFKIERHQVNQNLGAAVRTGIKASSAPIIATVDADCSYDPEILSDMVDELNKGHDFVSASALLKGGGFKRKIPTSRFIFSHTLPRLYNLVLWRPYLSYTSLVRVYKRQCLENIQITSDGFLSMAEIMIKLILQGKSVAEFPAWSNFRVVGNSRMRVFSTILSHLKFIKKIIAYRLVGGQL